MTLSVIIFVFVVGMIALFITNYFIEQSKYKDNLKKKQSGNLLRENIVKSKLEEYASRKVKYTKRYKIETMCLQAGFKLSYAEYMMIALASSVLMFFIALIALNNILVGFLFIFIGYLAPGQVILYIRNQRVAKMNSQIGPFIYMLTTRYGNTRNMKKAIELTVVEFKGEYPIYKELLELKAQLDLNTDTNESLKEFGRRTGNRFMLRFADYAKITTDVGTDQARKNILTKAYEQYMEDYEAKRLLKKELNGLRNDSYIGLAAIPLFGLYQAMTNDNYISFMTKTTMGQVGTFVVMCIFLGCFWMINNLIAKPLD